jgi:cation diffusion facilitator family transporter
MTQTIETPVVHDQARLSQEAKRVTYIGAWLDALLSIVKVVIGFMVGSAALIADGIHSLSDLVTDGFVLAAIHYGRQEPDKDHHYGHGRIETLTTLLLGSDCLVEPGSPV